MRASIFGHTMKIALYFGSFNPIHNGHLRVAHETLRQQKPDEVWFVVSPQNPFKENLELAPEEDRLRMAQLACSHQENIRVCDIEFGLTRPSFTVDTLSALRKKHPEYTFQLIMGEDNLEGLHRWKEYERLLALVEVIVYPRTSEAPVVPGTLGSFVGRIHFLTGELIAISATDIRDRIRAATTIEGLTTPEVIEYIEKNKLYH